MRVAWVFETAVSDLKTRKRVPATNVAFIELLTSWPRVIIQQEGRQEAEALWRKLRMTYYPYRHDGCASHSWFLLKCKLNL